MSQASPSTLRGYASRLTSALNACGDGAYVKIDWTTAHEVRKILLETAKQMEQKPCN